MALGDEVTQHGLRQHRGTARANRRHGRDTLDQIRRDDEVAESQAEEEHLAEAAREQHDAIPVEPLQGRHRLPGVAVLAVVVILE